MNKATENTEHLWTSVTSIAKVIENKEQRRIGSMNPYVVHANVTEHKWTPVSSTPMSLNTNEPLCRPRQCHWTQMNLCVVHANVTELNGVGSTLWIPVSLHEQ